jgi:hemerythrin-like domain-containing protein
MNTMTRMTSLEQPIDVMSLIHKALRVEATKLEDIVKNLEIGGSLQTFNLGFSAFATALIYHADQEDHYFSDPLTDCHPTGCAASLSSDKSQVTGLADRVREVLIAQEEELHEELIQNVQDVLTLLEEDIGATSLILRTKQHLFRQVVRLRIALEDHLESEEALVIPLMRRQMDRQSQENLARDLLFDKDAQDQSWMIDWINQRLDPDEQALLAGAVLFR